MQTTSSWIALALTLGACTIPDADLAPDTAFGDTGGVDASKVDVGAIDTSVGSDVGTDVTVSDATDTAAEAGRDLGSDKTKFFGDPRCTTAGVLLCEDFESGTLDTKTWSVGGTAPVVDGAQHARGTKALHITRVNNGNSTIKETKTFPAPKNRYFGRMFVYFNSIPKPDTTVTPAFTFAHWTIIAASGTGVTGEIRLSGMLQSGVNHFGAGTDSGSDPAGTGDWTSLDKDPAGKPAPVPEKDWTCIEWMHDGAANETRFWWDGVEHPSMHTTSTVHGGNTNAFVLPQFTQVVLGWNEYQTSTQTYESWIDEIIIDKERIGCVL